MQFEWDEEKAKINSKKYGVSFTEVETVFEDAFYIDFYDDEHSFEEQRFLIIGKSNKNRLLIVS